MVQSKPVRKQPFPQDHCDFFFSFTVWVVQWAFYVLHTQTSHLKYSFIFYWEMKDLRRVLLFWTEFTADCFTLSCLRYFYFYFFSVFVEGSERHRMKFYDSFILSWGLAVTLRPRFWRYPWCYCTGAPLLWCKPFLIALALIFCFCFLFLVKSWVHSAGCFIVGSNWSVARRTKAPVLIHRHPVSCSSSRMPSWCLLISTDECSSLVESNSADLQTTKKKVLSTNLIQCMTPCFLWGRMKSDFCI